MPVFLNVFLIFLFRNALLTNCTTIRPSESPTRETFVYTLLIRNVTDGILSLMAMNAVVLCRLIQFFTPTLEVEVPIPPVLIYLKVSVRISRGARSVLNSG